MTEVEADDNKPVSTASRRETSATARVDLGGPLTSIGVLSLQRRVGNKAVATMLARRPVSVQRHSVEPRFSGEEIEERQQEAEQEEAEQEEQGHGPGVQRLALARAARLSVKDISLQRGPIDWAKKKYNKWRNPAKGAYNIRRGEALPTEQEQAKSSIEERLGATTDIANKAQSHQTGVAWNILYNESKLEEIWRALVENLEVQNKPAPTHDDLLDFRLMAGDALGSEKDVLSAYAKKFVPAAKQSGKQVQLLALWGAFYTSVTAGSAQVLNESEELHSDRKYITPELSNSGAAANFLAKRQNVKLDHAYVPAEEIRPFAAALKKLPTVDFLLNGGGAKGQATKAADGAPHWKDGGSMADSIKVEDDGSGLDKRRAKRRIDHKFKDKVGRVDTWLKGMLPQEFVVKIPRPKVVVHTKSSPSYRASAGRGTMNLAHNEATNVVAHEAGHVIEEHLPMKSWHDMHLMLSKRHEAAGGGGAKSGENIVTKYSEGRWGGNYVTGDYTSTAYRSGNAEVVSMALQFLSDPKDALKLIDGDPMHAAIVLRSFKPQEYKSSVALRPFDKYLPSKQP